VKQRVLCPRFRCIRCGTVMTVVPATVVARKHFSGAAVALALTLWGLCGWSAARVRAAVAAWAHPGTTQGGWRTLTRWAREAQQGRLFSSLDARAEGRPRQVAARIAQALSGCAPPPVRHLGLEHQAWAGACRVA
jgi:hypothetical protein